MGIKNNNTARWSQLLSYMLDIIPWSMSKSTSFEVVVIHTMSNINREMYFTVWSWHCSNVMRFLNNVSDVQLSTYYEIWHSQMSIVELYLKWGAGSGAAYPNCLKLNSSLIAYPNSRRIMALKTRSRLSLFLLINACTYVSELILALRMSAELSSLSDGDNICRVCRILCCLCGICLGH